MHATVKSGNLYPEFAPKLNYYAYIYQRPDDRASTSNIYVYTTCLKISRTRITIKIFLQKYVEKTKWVTNVLQTWCYITNNISIKLLQPYDTKCKTCITPKQYRNIIKYKKKPPSQKNN